MLPQECLCLAELSAALKRRCCCCSKVSEDLWRLQAVVLLGLTSTCDKSPCNQSLFSLNPLLGFHNRFRLCLPPECACDVKGTLSGVGDCQQVRTPLLCSPLHVGDPRSKL